MSEERTYLVIPASVIAEHARPVRGKERWEAWRTARDCNPELERERCVVIAQSLAYEVGGETWGPR